MSEIKSLEARANERYSSLSEEGIAVVSRFRRYFNDYLQGEIFEPHPDMLDALRESGLNEEQRNLILDYCALNCATNGLPHAVDDFLANYEVLRYDPRFTLDNFLLSWNAHDKTLVNGNSVGTYSPLLNGVIEHLERTKELKNHEYLEALKYMEGVDGFNRYGILSVIVSNPELITGLVLETLSDKAKKRVVDILEDRILAREAASEFLKAYETYRDDANYKRGIERFLDRFDIKDNAFAKKRIGGQYRPMLRRLKERHGVRWRDFFFELLEDPIKSRAVTLDEEVGKKGIREEDRIRFVEKLVQENMFGYLALMQDEGIDGSDLLLASRLSTLNEKDRELLKDMTKRKRSLGRYLGSCRIPRANNAVNYDAKRCLKDICTAINPVVFAQSDVIATILLTKKRALYEEQFVKDQNATILEIEKEKDEETNEVERKLLSQTLEHFRLRKKVGQVKGMVKSLIVIE
ncbi:MAG: hypothetical protein AABY16_01125 [Nanoarchaeota archaeon]